MSALNSNLSSSTYNYDLVSALSQDGLNSYMKSFLSSLGTKNIAITAYYKFNDQSHQGVTLMTSEEVQAMINGYDIFTIPNGTNTSDSNYGAVITNLAEAGFAYALEAEMGVPTDIPSYHLPDVLAFEPETFDQNGNVTNAQKVMYYSYYKSFKIIELTYGWNLASISNISQDTYVDKDGNIPNPWTFSWEVNLNLSTPYTSEFQNLPTDVKNYLQSAQINPNTMFTMQQLFLDLNSPRLVSGASPSLFNFPANDPIYSTLNDFIANIWTILRNEGGVVFNTSLRPSSTADFPPSSIIPTSVNFMISPYNADKNQLGLYTLNYLVMSENRGMPALKPFNWDWVTSDSVMGIMSARRDIFLGYLNQTLSKCLKDICYQPTVDVDMDGRFVVGLTPTSDTLTYTMHPSNPMLTFSFDKPAEDNAGLFGALYSAKLELKVDSNVQYNGNQIICTTVLTLYADIYTALATTKGYAVAQQNVTTFTMTGVGSSTTNAGVLAVSASAVNTNLVQYDDKNKPYYGGNLNDPSYWSQIITWGAINDYVDTLQHLTNSVNNLMNNYNDDIANICSNCLGFTFPGAGTYFFSNPIFSQNNDLTVQLSLPTLS